MSRVGRSFGCSVDDVPVRARSARRDPRRGGRAVGGPYGEAVDRRERTDADVIARSLDDPHAFATIFDRHHEGIYRFVWTRAGPDRADDLAAEVFRVAFERRDAYDLDYPSATPWLFGIAARLTKQQHRTAAKRSRARTRIAHDRRQTQAVSPEQRLDELSTHGSVADALSELPERDRQPLLLYAWGELTYEEVARSLDIPVGTVRSRIHRARYQLRERLADTGPERAERPGGGTDD